MDLEAKISSIVSKTLYITEKGLSSKMAKLHKNFANTESMLFAAVHTPNMQQCYGGSMAEGTSSRRSDVDRMMVVPNILVVSNRQKNTDIYGHIFRMDSRKCPAGFYKLVAQRVQSRRQDFFDFYQRDINNMLEKDNEENVCLSPTEMYKFLVLISEKNAPCAYEYFRHGPAASSSFRFTKENIVNEFDIDFCLGLRVDEWPAEADEWLTRQRTCNWPNKDLIEKIRSLDCHLVPVGDKASQFKNIEWRMSFLLCERELVWSFNDIQIQLYFLLKELLKTELKKHSDELSSYCVKTAVFWYSESHNPSEWKDYDLLGLVKDCLLFILSFIKKRYLPHFFNYRRNLLSSKFTLFKTKEDVIEIIETLSKNSILPVLNLLEQKDIKEAWNNAKKDPNTFLQECKNINFLAFRSFQKHRNQHERETISEFLRCTSTTIVNDNFNDLVAKWKYLNSHKCDDIDHEFIEQVKKKIGVNVLNAL